MRTHLLARHCRAITFLIVIYLVSVAGLAAQVPVVDMSVVNAAVDSVVTVLLVNDGQAQAVGSGLVVRSDGYILVPYSLVKGTREVQVRLRNGETYDRAEIVSSDERRNVAILRINAALLSIMPNGVTEETHVGSRVFALTNPNGQVLVKSDLTLNAVQMADSVPGAGKGYRVLQFDAITGSNSVGGLLLDENGRSLGIITTTPEVKNQNIAVPLSSVLGMIRSVPANTTQRYNARTETAAYASPAQTPYPVPQSSVVVPQRGVLPLDPKGPGSVVVKPSTIPEILAASKTIYVESNTVFFKPEQLINALNERKEMAAWGFTFVNDRKVADLILELDHVVLTYKFTFSLYSQRLGTVVATGNRIILDGNLGAPYMAERFVEKVKLARGDGAKTPNVKPAATPDDKTKKDSK